MVSYSESSGYEMKVVSERMSQREREGGGSKVQMKMGG